MSRIVYTDRSRIESYQRCNRLRFLEYHEGPEHRGIQPARKSLALCVGGSVHRGLESLLRNEIDANRVSLSTIEDVAVIAALDDFAIHRSALALDTTELAAQSQPGDLTAQLASAAADLGMSPDDPSLVALAQVQRTQQADYEGWLWQEQAALVEGMVRAYARRRLRLLLEEYEVLEVEREGEWTLAEVPALYNVQGLHLEPPTSYEIVFMSRPDALLRSRQDNSLYLLSFKTASTWDIRKARDAEHDMQGLSEGVEVERRLGEWWDQIKLASKDRGDGGVSMDVLADEGMSQAMYDFLRSIPAPPRILGIRYEYLLKGSRWEDKDLSARFGIRVWAQRSHLVRAYAGDAGWCWSYDFLKDDGSASKLYYRSWRPRSVWESMSMREWIDMLDTATESMSAYDSTVGQEPRLLGWKSDAQAQGYTAEHPLDAVFVPPMTIYRQDDDLRDWIEETESQEREVAEHVAAVDAVSDEGERRHLLNLYFRRTRRACEYPSTCAMSKVCWGADDLRADPIGSGLYKVRSVNHPQELGADDGVRKEE